MSSSEMVTAIVSGSASGIGRAVSALFIERGYKVYGLDRVQSDDLMVEQLMCDVSNQSDVQRAVKRIVNNSSGIDILVNAAGIFQEHKRNEIGSLDISEWDSIINNNLRSVFIVTQSCLPYMKGTGSAAIVNVSSDQAFFPREKNSAYATSKAGIACFTKICAREFVKYGIRVNAVAPASVRTGFLDCVFAESSLREEAYRREERKMPLGMISAEEVADTILFLADQRNGKITGQTIIIDSGLYS